MFYFNFYIWLYIIYCRTGFIRPGFNFAHFAQLTVGEFNTRANKHSHIACTSSLYCNWANSKPVETEVPDSQVGENKVGRIFCVLQYINLRIKGG